MDKIYHSKLIRDKIPKLIEKRGGEYKTKILGKKEFEKELKKKLVEESNEVLRASNNELVDELSDVLELIKSIASHYKINFKKVENRQVKKRKERGGFAKKLFLVWSSKR